MTHTALGISCTPDRSGSRTPTIVGAHEASSRRQVLCHLAKQGPTALWSLPRRWPVTRYHLRHVVSRLMDEGLVEAASGEGWWSGNATIALTDVGRAALQIGEASAAERATGGGDR